MTPVSICRVAIVFDNTARPETTGGYCLRALRELVQVEHFLPADLEKLPRQGFDLYLRVDDGLNYPWPGDLQPCAWWAIDTHLNFDWCRDHSRAYDHVFAAQRDGAEQLRREGIRSARWLPLACDPVIHRRQEVTKEFDLCFIGNLFPGPRQELIDLLRQHHPRMHVGRCYFEEMARAYSSSRLVFNRSIRNDINMRVFEAVSCGSLLLTNDLCDNGQEELFRDGVHLATYRDAAELLEKASFYLRQEEIREGIAAAGREHTLAHHTYRQRMETLLTEVERAQSRTTASIPAPPPRRDVPAAPATADVRDQHYYEFARPELMALVPPTAQRVLDIGCGAGCLGAAIKERQNATVIGVEFDESAARLARTRLDEVLVGDIEQMETPFEPGSFDAVVCGDVLEHLRDPGRLLNRIRGWLHPAGCLITSIPNVQHHSVIRGLLLGNWTYEPAGLLDRDHLRFFTRREIEKLLARTGFAIQSIQVVLGPGDQQRQASCAAGEIAVGRLRIGGLSPVQAQEFYAYQYLVRAVPDALPEHGLTSIVILTHNQLDFTRLCVDSIRERTQEPHELIFVDNASTDGTLDYLRSFPGARVIANTENRGFPAAVNQGIQIARGSQVLLLNNDTVVTTGWLGRMLQAFHRDPKIGLVGPCSNCVSGEQQVSVSYDSLDELDGFAWDWSRGRDQIIEDTDRLVGFCFLIRREVIEQIGLLDEGFGVGCFEDDDYCLRAINAGFRAVIARDSFVHHFGGQTFRASGINFASLLQQNQERFRAKWADKAQTSSQPVQIASPVPARSDPRYTIQVPEQGGLLLVRGGGGILLSLCMIVRDNARTIGAALQSIRPYVDEMVVVDTGSTDDTPQIAQQLGARVFHFPWCDDFSAARNESLKYARGQWIFWMDSDDTIDPDCGCKLRQLALQDPGPSILGHVIQVHCPGPPGEDEDNVTEVDHVKLFRNLPELRFEGRIHEQILPAIRRLGGEVAWTDLFVTHTGYDHTPEGQIRKKDRDLRLLHLEHRERGEHTFTLFNLGMTYADIGQPREAVEYLQRCIACSQQTESHLRKAFALLVHSLRQLGRKEVAWQVCEDGLKHFPQDPELTFRRAILLHDRGQLELAVRMYLELLGDNPERHFTSVDRGIRSFKARFNLALVYEDLGDLAQAEEQCRLAVKEQPGFRAAWHELANLLLRQGRQDEALRMADQLLSRDHLCVEGLLILARAASGDGQHDRTRRWLEQAIREFPNDADAWQEWCRFLFDRGSAGEAQQALLELLLRWPDDASAHHNLGTLHLQAGRAELAAAAYQESLRLRPDSPGTRSQLEQALLALQRGKATSQPQEPSGTAPPIQPHDHPSKDEKRSA
jgi:GT2 family glycosyltransferase/tetratricopeptide (TPR) repeat protein/2-polyprenyl-3-methyl-5-hydroxy-6-metoxy-1,4-benzoquinol methylase